MSLSFCNTCAITAIFLIANIFVMFSSMNINKDYFYTTLDDELINRYENIIRERRNIYYTGFILGILLSFILLAGIHSRNIRLDKISAICLVGSVTFITNYLYYIVYPKSDYMVLHLDNKEQRQEWLELNKSMKNRVHLGFVLGIIAVMVFANVYKD